MPAPKNAMEIFQLLDQSNCRDCGEKTCLAFAGAVYQGHRAITECPKLDDSIIERFSGSDRDKKNIQENREEWMEAMRQSIASIDFKEAAKRTGGRRHHDRLILKILGKDFGVDHQGNLFSDIHVNPWIAAPFFDYVINAKGTVNSTLTFWSAISWE
jgi:hypothetical protein